MAIAFVGWYYDPQFDSVDAVFEDLDFHDPELAATTTGYFAYTHIGQHGDLVWPPTGRKISFNTALKHDRSTVEEVLELYGRVPGVLPALGDLNPEGRELYRRYSQQNSTLGKIHTKPYVRFYGPA